MTQPLPSQTFASPALSALRARISRPPEVALVLGSGLGAAADGISDCVTIDYAELPNMPTSAVAGHAGRFSIGTLAGKSVIAMQGRVHLYEAYNAEQVVFGVRLMLSLGARTLILSNAAGGIRSDLQPGTLMLIEDQHQPHRTQLPDRQERPSARHAFSGHERGLRRPAARRRRAHRRLAPGQRGARRIRGLARAQLRTLTTPPTTFRFRPGGWSRLGTQVTI